MRIPPSLRLLSLVLILSLTGCANSALFLTNHLARLGNYELTESIAYGPQALNYLDVYTPEKLTEKRPVVIFFYGGCWGACNIINKENYTFVAEFLTAQGYVVVIPDYRRHPEHTFTAIIEDAKNAVEWVKTHAASYGGDHQQLFLMGFSSGGHMAAMLTLNEDYLTPETHQSLRGFIGLAGPYDFEVKKPYQQSIFGPPENYRNTLLTNFVDGTEPPLLLLYGNDDKLVYPRNLINLSNEVKRCGGQVESQRYEGIDHIGLLASLSILRRNPAVTGIILRFLAQHSQQHSPKVNVVLLK